MTDKELLKECFDTLTETVQILIGEKLEVVKKYAILEDKIKKQLGQPSDKPSLFDVKGNPAPDPVQPVATKTPTAQLAEQPPEFPEPPTEVITDPVKRVSKSFDGPFPPGDPRSTTPEQKKELTDPKNHTGDLPWETRIPQLNKKNPPVIPQTTGRPHPEKPGESIFDNLP